MRDSDRKLNKKNKTVNSRPGCSKVNLYWAGIVSTVNYLYKLSTLQRLLIFCPSCFVCGEEQTGAMNYLTRTCAILVVNLPNPFE